jgi:DHA2 family metal-tetracycline-proton antiporter-like MFS transporter
MNDTTYVDRSNQVAEGQPAFRDGLVIPLLGFTVILVIMNTMMFNLALPQVTTDFGLTSATASWIITGYSVVFAIASITYSRLSDFVPIRRLLTIGLLTLGSASLIGFFSHHYLLLLVARLIQASGAGAIVSLSFVLIARFIPLSRRGKAMAIISSSVSLGLGLGPVVGGAITQYWGWNDLFLVTGISLLLVPLFFRLLPKEPVNKGHFDLLGALLIGIGSTGLLLAMTNRLWIAFVIGLAALGLFWLRINRAKTPFVQPALFHNKLYIRLIALGIIGYISSFSTLFLLPQLLIRHFGLTTGHAGFIIFPGALVAVFAANPIGRMIDRYGSAPLLRYAPWLLLAASSLFALLAGSSVYLILFIYMIMSTGYSALNSSVSNELSRILPAHHVGAGLGLFQLLQFISGAFSVAISGMALAAQSKQPLELAFSHIFIGMAVLGLLALATSWLYRSALQKQHMQKQEQAA